MDTLEQTRMTTFDILAIIRVFDTLDNSEISSLDVVAVINCLKRYGSIDDQKYQRLLQKYVGYGGSPANRMYSFAKSTFGHVSFFEFVQALNDAGYVGLCQQLYTERKRSNSKVNWGVARRELPNADILQKYYLYLKKSADNNVFRNKAGEVLKDFVTSFDKQIVLCEDINKRQILIDKRSIVYFLLCQLCPNIGRRNSILKEMRDSMPKDVDRTVFDTVFHSYMALNWAISGNETTAEHHERQARIACSSCIPGLVTMIMSQWTQYKNNALYLKGECKENVYIGRARTDFSVIQQCLENCGNEDQLIWRTISTLDMSRSLLGIDLYLNVCDIGKISKENIDKAGQMFRNLPVPTDVRRRMYYLIIQGRLLEQNDPSQAKVWIGKALSIAADGCYYEVEKQNILEYLSRLTLPRPSL